MKMYSLFKAILPLIVMSGIVSLLYFVPVNQELQPSAISPQLPYNDELDGWYGERTQASERERSILSRDTKFSKGVYRRSGFSVGDSSTALDSSDSSDEVYVYGPQVSVSIVYSGMDMNGSIHRPEFCLPSQGHQQLKRSDCEIKLASGRTVSLTKLDSLTVGDYHKEGVTNHIHYYVFIGHSNITHSHAYRTLYDIWHRVINGRVQSWAYLQLGSCWGGDTGITEKEADEAVLELMSRLLERQVDWAAIEN